MPLIRIDVPEGVSGDVKKQIHSKVREVVLKKFNMIMFLLEKHLDI